MCKHKWFADRCEDAIDRAVNERDWDAAEFLEEMFELAECFPLEVVERALTMMQHGSNFHPCCKADSWSKN